jgi:hypothetical protein
LDTIVGVIAAGLGVFMLVTLVKYAKFINRYPHEVEKARQEKLAREANADRDGDAGNPANR